MAFLQGAVLGVQHGMLLYHCLLQRCVALHEAFLQYLLRRMRLPQLIVLLLKPPMLFFQFRILLPQSGVVLPQPGVVLPQSGVVLPQSGAVLPQPGVVLP